MVQDPSICRDTTLTAWVFVAALEMRTAVVEMDRNCHVHAVFCAGEHLGVAYICLMVVSLHENAKVASRGL